jgi:3-dehydroquinate synthase
MVMAAELSGLNDDDAARLKNLLASAGLPTAPPPAGSQALLDAMGFDKKVQQKQLRFVLLSALGEAYVSSDYDQARLLHILEVAD